MTKFKKCILVTVLVILASCAGQPDRDPPYLAEKDNHAFNYFDEIAFGSEFGGGSDAIIRKWVNDINIIVKGDAPDYLLQELQSIIQEINGLVGDIKINMVDDEDESNYFIYFGRHQEYARRLKNKAAAAAARRNYGMFWIYWNENDEIYNGSMYVDTTRAKSKELEKHLLREELTQSLGLARDSYRYPDSIFYQDQSYTTSYSAVDQFLIYVLYNPKIKAGMTRKEVSDVIQESEYK